jgi:ATP/maltotriose-dependent transcriptional regulator MalT
MARGCWGEAHLRTPKKRCSPAVPVVVRPPTTLLLGVVALCQPNRKLLGPVAPGRSLAQVAGATPVTANTVRTRIRTVRRKVDVDGPDQAAAQAWTPGLRCP